MPFGSLTAAILIVAALAIAGMPGSPSDTTADVELGQIDFVHNAPDFLTAKSLDFGTGNGHTGGFIAIDQNSSPNHLYVADAPNSRILGWNNAASFTNGQAADLIIGQLDQYSVQSNQGGSASLSTLSGPEWLAVDSLGDLWVSDDGNLRVLKFPDPFTQVAPVTASNAYSFSTSCNGNHGPQALAFDGSNNLYLGTASG